MIAKTIEVRDRLTFIPMLAIRLDPGNEADWYLLSRAGFRPDPGIQTEVLLARISGGSYEMHCYAHEWKTGFRTVEIAHRWLIEHFDEIESGAVVDVEFILGETTQPKVSEAVTDSVP